MKDRTQKREKLFLWFENLWLDDLVLLYVDTGFMQKLPRKERRNDCGDESHMKVRVEDFGCQVFSQSLSLMQEASGSHHLALSSCCCLSGFWVFTTAQGQSYPLCWWHPSELPGPLFPSSCISIICRVSDCIKALDPLEKTEPWLWRQVLIWESLESLGQCLLTNIHSEVG